MAKSSWEDDVLRGSVVDRLIAGESGAGGGTSYDYVGVRELRASVATHLEWLLNSKSWIPQDMENFPEASRSNLTYGLRDLSGLSWKSSSDAAMISRQIEDAIRRFEPRLLPQSIRVESTPSGGIDDFTLGFRIDAVLNVDPIREPVSFNTDMEIGTNQIRVSGED